MRMEIEKHFVKDEARDFVFSEIMKLIDKYSDGAITFMDVYYRIMAEPLLNDDDKRQILMSPTRETVLKLWKGKKPDYVINGVAIPVDAVVVVESKAKMYRYVQQYSFLKPILSKPVSLGIMTALKCISMIVKGMRKTIVIPDLPWNHEDALTMIVVMTRLANIKLITNMPVVLKEEINTKINPRLASLGDTYTLFVSVKNITRKFEPALRKFVEDSKLENVVKSLYDIDVHELEWRDDWWNYLGIDTNFDKELYSEAIKYGVPKEAAKKIASWKVRTIRDLVKLIREVRMIILDDQYFTRTIEFLAMKYNYRAEVLLAMLGYFEIIKEDMYNNKGQRIQRKYLKTSDGRVIHL